MAFRIDGSEMSTTATRGYWVCTHLYLTLGVVTVPPAAGGGGSGVGMSRQNRNRSRLSPEGYLLATTRLGRDQAVTRYSALQVLLIELTL